MKYSTHRSRGDFVTARTHNLLASLSVPVYINGKQSLAYFKTHKIHVHYSDDMRKRSSGNTWIVKVFREYMVCEDPAQLVHSIHNSCYVSRYVFVLLFLHEDVSRGTH